MKRLLPVLLLTLPLFVHAQIKTDEEMAKKIQAAEADADTAKPSGWVPVAVAGLNLTQTSFTDWAQGGANSLAYSARVLSNLTYYGERAKWSNSLKLLFGQARLSGQGLRKTEDEIYLESLFIYEVWELVNPYAAATVRTQFAPGYEYPENADKQQISAFFDPAYFTESIGFIYEPSPIFTSRLGVAAREVVTSQYRVFANDPETPVGDWKSTRVDAGLESISVLRWEFAPNMLLTSRLELFSAFDMMERVIVRSDNAIAAKVNEYVSVGINLQLINDAYVRPQTQIMESISVGLSYVLL